MPALAFGRAPGSALAADAWPGIPAAHHRPAGLWQATFSGVKTTIMDAAGNPEVRQRCLQLCAMARKPHALAAR